MTNPKDKIIQHFNEELEVFSKKHSLKIGNDTKIKLGETYAMTLLLEKDVTPYNWLHENLKDIMTTYAEDIEEIGDENV